MHRKNGRRKAKGLLPNPSRHSPSCSSNLLFYTPSGQVKRLLPKCNHAEYQHEQSDGFAKTHNGNVLSKALSCFSHGIRACRSGFSLNHR